MKILLLSDTHSYLDDRILAYAGECDEIWHAGDFGNVDLLDKLEKITSVRGVYGNIDGTDIRKIVPEVNCFTCEGVKVLMIHIGGYPGKYTPLAKQKISEEKPQLFISGHSHILKAQYDQKNSVLHLNPGAAGKTGWHQVRTMMRFDIEHSEVKNLEVIELGKR